jgi:probable F420-dependent oxidoreductase
MSGVKIGIGFGLWRLGMPSPDTICSYAERAEALGIDSIWLSDHIVSRNPELEISCIMAMFAARTKKIKMGPSVLTLPARDPVQVAKTYATLDYLSGSCGRVIMAVGLGSDPRDCLACGIPPEERAKRMEEGVQVLRKLWAGPHVTHEGRFYKFTDVTIEPRPAKGSLDIWIGGKSDLAIKRTARYGDGWFPSFVTPEEFKAGMEKLASYGAQYGRTVNPREAGVLILTHASHNRTRAQEIAQKFFHGFPLPSESLPARCAIGTPEECVEKIQSYVDVGCSKFVLWPVAPPDELVTQVEIYGREIVPHFA